MSAIAPSDATSEQEPGRRRAVLRVVRASPVPMSIIAIAEVLGVHPNTVRFHLDSLVGDGLVEHVEPGRKGPGRPPLMFQAVRQMDRGGTRHYRLLAEILAIGLAAEQDPSAKAPGRGRAWGERLESRARSPSVEDSIERLVDVLDELGFAPERRSVGRQPAGRPAALPVPGARRKAARRDLSGPPGSHARSLGNLGGAGRPSSGSTHSSEPDLCSGPPRAGSCGTVNAGPAIAVAVTFVWLGMVLAISFLEAPLKFRAPNVTLPDRAGHRAPGLSRAQHRRGRYSPWSSGAIVVAGPTPVRIIVGVCPWPSPLWPSS